MSLPDRAAEAAFRLAQVYGEMEQDEVVRGGDVGDHQGGEEDEEEPALPWDEEVVELAPELKVMWNPAVTGDRRIDLKALLEEVPVFATLPRRAPANNYRVHGAYKNDKTLRAWQQTILQILRVQAEVLRAWMPAQAT